MIKGGVLLNDTVTFQQCTTKDWPLLQKISIETFSDTFKAQNTAENLQAYLKQAYTEEKLKAELTNPDSTFWFLQNNQELLGYLKVNVNTAQTETFAHQALEIERIYVRKNYKGQGYGSKMIQKAEAVAKTQSKKQIWLGVWEKNAPALAFYHRMNFVPIRSHTFYMGAEAQTDIIMIKDLEPRKGGHQ
jgi:ribosomal protein S18 acetylase RimI-like enzyme